MGAKTLNEVYDYALSLYGTPYQWGGGHDAMVGASYGLDCSGFLRKLVSYAGVGPLGEQTADSFYHYYLGNGHLNLAGMGAIAFFGTTAKIHHVGWCIDKRQMISAAGGGSHINTITQAKRLNASVKTEPINLRTDLVCVIMPFYQLPLGN